MGALTWYKWHQPSPFFSLLDYLCKIILLYLLLLFVICIVLCALEEVNGGGPNFCTGSKFKLYGTFSFLQFFAGLFWLPSEVGCELNIVHTCELLSFFFLAPLFCWTLCEFLRDTPLSSFSVYFSLNFFYVRLR